MATVTRGPDRPKVLMVTYGESPGTLPPMLNEGTSLARAGIEVESLHIAQTAAAMGTETHAPGYTSRRFRVRTRSVFRAVFGAAASNRAVLGAQNLLSFAEFFLKALLIAVRTPADLYEAHDLPALPPTLLAAKLRGKPIVYRAHELYSETHAKVRFAWIWRWLDRTLVPHCDEVVTPDEFRSRIYLEEFGASHLPLTIRNCPQYRPPIESRRLRDELERRGLRATTIVLYQGMVDSMRCIEEIAEASRQLDPGVVLVIVGGGYGAWSDPATRLAGYDRIVVLPQVPYEELFPITASADIGILLYRNDCRNNYYCAPNKVFEYMMMGLPLIAPDFPGMVALVQEGGVGLCVDPAKPEEIAAAINRLARDPDLRQRMREEGLRETRLRHNWQREFGPLEARLRALIGPGAAGPP